MVRSIDTNIILRLVLRDVPAQLEEIDILMHSSKPGSLSVADAVFFECVWILSGKMYKFDRSLIARLLLQITYMPQINCNRVMLEKAISLYVKHSKISFIDACLSVYAELNDAIPLLTFDRKLATALPKTVSAL